MKLYKVINPSGHYGLVYHPGENIDPKPFNPSFCCEDGGIYFAREDVLAFLDRGTLLAEVTIPAGEPVYENPGTPRKWKAHRVILGEFEEITPAVVERLISEGADIHADGDRPLCDAAWRGDIPLCELFLNHGADIHTRDGAPLRSAAERGYTAMCELFLNHGANIHAWGDEPLRAAAWRGDIPLCELFLNHGADIHTNGDVPLRDAAWRGYTAMCELFLNHGADIHTRDDEPLCNAESRGHTATFELLRAWMNKKA